MAELRETKQKATSWATPKFFSPIEAKMGLGTSLLAKCPSIGKTKGSKGIIAGQGPLLPSKPHLTSYAVPPNYGRDESVSHPP